MRPPQFSSLERGYLNISKPKEVILSREAGKDGQWGGEDSQSARKVSTSIFPVYSSARLDQAWGDDVWAERAVRLCPVTVFRGRDRKHLVAVDRSQGLVIFVGLGGAYEPCWTEICGENPLTGSSAEHCWLTLCWRERAGGHPGKVDHEAGSRRQREAQQACCVDLPSTLNRETVDLESSLVQPALMRDS